MQCSITFLERVLDKLYEILQHPITWLSGFGLFVLDAVTGGRLTIYIVVLASAIDLICGISVAIKRKNFVCSDLMRQTIEKLLVYGFVMLVFLCVDQVIERETALETDITSSVVGIIIALTESVSFTASLIIMFPNNAFLHMFQKMLTGELARKLNCEEHDVEKILAKSRRIKKQPREKNGRFVKKDHHKKHNSHDERANNQ